MNGLRVHEGGFLNHKKHGFGKEFDSNDRIIYKGCFENGERHCAGASHHARPGHLDVEIEHMGYWENGAFVNGECRDNAPASASASAPASASASASAPTPLSVVR